MNKVFPGSWSATVVCVYLGWGFQKMLLHWCFLDDFHEEKYCFLWFGRFVSLLFILTFALKRVITNVINSFLSQFPEDQAAPVQLSVVLTPANTVRKQFNSFISREQSYYIISLHLVLNSSQMYFLGTSCYFVNGQIGCTSVIVCHNFGKMEEVYCLVDINESKLLSLFSVYGHRWFPMCHCCSRIRNYGHVHLT